MELSEIFEQIHNVRCKGEMGLKDILKQIEDLQLKLREYDDTIRRYSLRCEDKNTEIRKLKEEIQSLQDLLRNTDNKNVRSAIITEIDNKKEEISNIKINSLDRETLELVMSNMKTLEDNLDKIIE